MLAAGGSLPIYVTLTEKGPGKRGQGRNVVGLEEPDYQRDSKEAVCEWGKQRYSPTLEAVSDRTWRRVTGERSETE